MAWGGALTATRGAITIDEERCDGCGACVPACQEGAIAIVNGKARLVDGGACDRLGACLGRCPRGAITLECVEAVPLDEIAAAHPLPVATRRGEPAASALRQWPVQLHLISPAAPHFRGADVLLAADCVAYALGEFHRAHLAGRALAIACPKLDTRQEVYLAKLVAMIDESGIASLTVMVMEVPCCSGLVRLARSAAASAARAIPVRALVVGVGGEILRAGAEPRLRDGRAATRLPVR